MRASPALALPLAAVLFSAGVTSGCTDRPYNSPQEQAANACKALGPKALSGALIGVVGGAAGGAGLGAIAGGGRGAAIGAGVGALAGLFGGLAVGHQADAQDCAQAQIALQELNTAPVNRPISWSNPQTGSHGTYIPTSDSYSSNGQICRRIRADYYMKDHQPITGDSGVVCRTPEGDWQRVGSSA